MPFQRDAGIVLTGSPFETPMGAGNRLPHIFLSFPCFSIYAVSAVRTCPGHFALYFSSFTASSFQAANLLDSSIYTKEQIFLPLRITLPCPSDPAAVPKPYGYKYNQPVQGCRPGKIYHHACLADLFIIRILQEHLGSAPYFSVQYLFIF